MCLGDSITAGVGAGPGGGYPEQLADLLKVEILNEGVSGDTSSQGLARLENVLDLDPWLVVVELGGNDLLQRRPIEDTERALRAIVEGLLEEQVLPVLVEIHGPLGGAFEELFEDLESDYRIPVLEDVLPRILRSPQLKNDPIHPNERGHALLAKELAGLLEPILEARQKAVE
ncbi:MAG: arylesterase [Deltaproteobacteria bacterium]|nr:arylesterase [Deltaproteobacteria bacterium]